MVTKMDVTDAQKRMDRARDELLAYAGRNEKNTQTHKKLVEELKAASDSFVNVVSQLGK